jgi:hypothetical protein
MHFPQALNAHRTNDLNRCQHRTNSGQCRRTAPQHSTLCARHAELARKEKQRDDTTDLSELLAQNLSDQKSAEGIHIHLWNLALALQHGKVTPHPPRVRKPIQTRGPPNYHRRPAPLARFSKPRRKSPSPSTAENRRCPIQLPIPPLQQNSTASTQQSPRLEHPPDNHIAHQTPTRYPPQFR